MGDSRDSNVGPDRADEPELQEPATEVADEGEAVSSDHATDPNDELARLRDALLRTRAEMDNLHKRSERELEKARRFINEALMKDLVPVLDTLDQAIETAGEADGNPDQGLQLIRKQLLHSMERHGLGVSDPQGEVFSPDWHEAMSMQPSAEHEPDTVMLVLQRGYTLHGRLLRPARVIVARAAG